MRATVRSFSPECNAFLPKKQHASHCVAKKLQACTCHDFKEKYQIYIRSTANPALIFECDSTQTESRLTDRSREGIPSIAQISELGNDLTLCSGQ
jgi:hypothetical protein